MIFINVLSLFDGMSCGQIALHRAGIPVDTYYASEIDKYAIQVTMKNYPDTIQLGDVTKWREWDFPEIDLLIGGSPCQGFSLAGKQLNFEDPRSKLFFEYVDILKAFKPKYFLLENVKMKKEYQDIISKYLGVEPIVINSSLVSAQNRVRLYWTNIPGIEQPKDKQIMLSDIIEYGYVDRDKSYCIDANYFKGGNLEQYFEKSRRQLVFGGAIRGRYDENGKIQQQLELRKDNKTNSLTTVQKDNVLVFEYDRKNGIGKELNKSIPILASDWRGLNRNQKQNAVVDFENLTYRKLTPIECERLQTIPDNYTNCVSNTQRYKMLGNGWTVDVISHILSYIK